VTCDGTGQEEIKPTQKLIITCEECGEVQHFVVANEQQVEHIFNNFCCAKKCDPVYYSYITISQIPFNRKDLLPSAQEYQQLTILDKSLN
jgi:hypothetical protein